VEWWYRPECATRENTPEIAGELLRAELPALATGVKQHRKILILRPHGSLELTCGPGVWLGLCAVKRKEDTSAGSSEGKSSGERMGVCKGTIRRADQRGRGFAGERGTHAWHFYYFLHFKDV